MKQGTFSFSDPNSKTAPTSKRSARTTKTPKVYSVTQLSRLIKLTLDEHLPKTVLLEGEISNFKHHPSGHLYLTLKDENAQIPTVMWKSATSRLKFRPTDGMAVIATGRIDVYEPQGKYQFYIEKLEPSGLGALELAFRQLAEKLKNEGLFDPQHKKPLPPFPQTIAILTADRSAALEDIKKTLNRRFGIVRKLFYPIAVQGENAAPQIAKALNDLNRLKPKEGPIDLIILARGGGNIEDLWAFNEEIVARAIHRCNIPIITGIGHEVDITIADMVADQRAATPTAAAEMAVPVLSDILDALSQTQQRLTTTVSRHYRQTQATFNTLASRPCFIRPHDAVGFRCQTLDEQQAQLNQTITQKLRNNEKYLESRLVTLRHIEPHFALRRGASQLNQKLSQLQTAAQTHLQNQQNTLNRQTLRFQALSPQRHLQPQQLNLKHLANHVQRHQKYFLHQKHQHLDHLQQHLNNLNPRNILQRGYSITTSKRTGKILSSDRPPKPGDTIITELANRKQLESTITKLHRNEDQND